MIKSKILLTVLITLILSNTSLFAGYYNQGCKYFVYKKYDKAREMFLKAIETSDHGDSYYFLGEIEKINGNFEESEEYYKAATTKNTTKKYLKNAFWNLVVLAERRGDYKTVVKTCREMWERVKDIGAKKKIESLINKYMWTDNKEAIAKYKEGVKLKQKNKVDESLIIFKESINMEPYFLAPKFEIGMIAYEKGELYEASGYLTEIASAIPFYAEVHLILGDIYFTKKNYRYAIEHFNSALEFGFINKKTEYTIKTKRGTCYYNEGNLESAEADIIDALNIKKKDVKPIILISAIYIKQKKYDEALKTLNMANRLKKDSPAILFQIGSIYYKKNDLRYLKYFDKLLDIAVRKKKLSGKYNRAFLILLKKHFEKKNYKRVSIIISELPGSFINYEIMLISARTFYHQKKFDKAIELFQKLSLNNDDKFMLCKAYYRSGNRKKAKDALTFLINNDELLEKAGNDRFLSRIVREIKSERKKREEEKKRLEEEEKRQIEEKKNDTEVN